MSSYARVPCSAASALAAARLRPQTAANSMPSVEASAGACAMRAQWPVPTSPNLSVRTGAVILSTLVQW